MRPSLLVCLLIALTAGTSIFSRPPTTHTLKLAGTPVISMGEVFRGY